MLKNRFTPHRFAKTFLFAAAATFSASLAPVPAEAATSSYTIDDDVSSGTSVTISSGGKLYVDSSLTATFSGNLTLSGSATFYIPSSSSLTFDENSSVSGTTLMRYNSSSYTGTLTFEGDVDLTYLYNYYGTTNFTGADVEIDYLYNYYGTTNFDGADATIGTIRISNSTGAINVYGGTNLTLSGLYSSSYGTLSFGNATVTFDTTFSSSRKIALSTSLDDNYTGTTFCVADGATVTLSGTLSGSGSLEKTGAGTLTLSGSNTYSGGTTISAGTLSVASTSYLGSGEIYVGSAGTLAVTTSTAGFSDTDISGTGTVSVALTSSSSNTLQIGDGTSFTGTTYVSSGYLNYTSSTAFGSTLELASGTRLYSSSSATFSGNLVLDGTTYFCLYSGASLTFDENSSVSGDTFRNYWYGTVTFRGDVDLETFLADTYSSGITNFDGATAEIGALKFSTSATVNIYGDTEMTLGGISGTSGTLSLGNATIAAETSWSTSRAIVLSDSLDETYTGTVFEIADGATVELSGTLSGSGSLEKTGAGTLTLSGSNTYSGGTTISAGTLSVASTSALGSGEISVASGATLELDFGSTKTYSNTFGGAGTVRVASGTTVGFSGDFGAKTLSVASGATLSGSVSFSAESAVLELAGTLALSSTETVSATGTLTVELSESATLDLTGYSITLMRYGATLTIFDGNDITFTVASSDDDSSENSSSLSTQSASGSDSSVADAIENFLLSDSGIASLAESEALVYSTSDGLSVQLASNYTSISVSSHDGLSGLASAIFGNLSEDLEIAAGLYSEEELSEIYGVDFSDPIISAAIAGTGNAGTLLETFSPLSYAALVAVPVAAFQNDVRNVLSRLDLRRFSVYEGREWQIYAQAQYLNTENDDASDTPTFDYNLLGILAGADRRLSPTTLVGIALAAGTGEAEVHHGGGEIEITDYRLTGYVSKLFAQKIAFDFGAQAGLGDYEIKRKTAYGNVRGDTDSWNFGVFGNVSSWLQLSQNYEIFAEPFIGVAAMYSSVSGFTEGGNGGKFDVDDFDALSIAASVGCNFAWEFTMLGTKSRIGVGIAYTHEFCDDEVDIDARFIGGNTKYGVSAAALASDRFSLGPTLEIGLTQSLGVYAGYTFEIGTDSSASHSANIGLRASF